MLSTLARVATRRPRTVILTWIALIVLGFGLGTGVFGRLSDAVPDVPGTESDRTAQLLDDVDPRGEALTAVVEAPRVTDPELRAQVERSVADLRRVTGVAAVPDPYATEGLASRDGRALIVPVTLKGGLDDDQEDETVDAVADRVKAIDGGDVHVSGGPLLGKQLGERAQEDVKRAELISLPVVLGLLLLIFGGLRAAGLPLLVAVSGVAGAFLALFGFSQITEISVYVVQVTTMLGLGLAVDYALLMVVRFREERRTGADVAEAVHRTVERAGRTILFSGLTVAVSLSGLLVFPSPFLRSMGLAVAAVVVVDMLAALTLLPALLTRFGARIAPAKKLPPGAEGRVFARLARFAARRPLAVTTVSVLALLTLALPVSNLRIDIGDARQLPASTEARQVYDAVDAHYPAGAGVDPIVVVARPGTDPAFASRVKALDGVASAETQTLDDGTRVLRVTPAGPADGATATQLVEKVRELRADEPVKVAGTAARLVDFRHMIGDRAPWAALTVLLGILALLFAFTGSVLIPLRTVLTTLLSLGAALGVVVLVFQDGHFASWLGGEGLGSLSLTAPPLIVAIAFGLAMDYELFILARMRESWHATGDAREAVVTGLRRSGRVVSCAALLLAVVFGAFMTGGFAPILEIGLGLTLAVVIDATLVRMLLVPATMALMGTRAWWAPRALRTLHDRFGLHEEAPSERELVPRP
ncbi:MULTISPECIES: MMPL family transporter [unclassified Streptomyces]|uniref:MMPL family transporter n=1 Tax=unclassified Streptomyces TaxID=2593676 RepID=UPI00278BBE11|nr:MULTISPECIES: MMPL family transporter [unclassified Streptomyces]